MKYLATPLLLAVIATVIGSTLPRTQPAVKASATQEGAASSQARRVFAAGAVEGNDRNVPLRFKAAGSIARIHVQEGDHVKRGDVIASLDDQTWKCRVNEANARLALAKAEVSRLANGSSKEARIVAKARLQALELKREQARTDVERIHRLLQNSATTERDRITAENQFALAAAECTEAEAALAEIEAPARADDLEIAQAKVGVAQTEVQLAEAALDETLLRAPADGMILRINASAGETTQSLASDPVVVMADTSRIRVRAYVEELDALSIGLGNPATVMADGRGSNEYRGRIEWIAPSMQPKSHRNGKPTEHFDVAVREVVIGLEGVTDFPIGLPVEVFIEPCGTVAATPPTPVVAPANANSEEFSRRMETAQLPREDNSP